jgi:hypothetical protein
MRVLFVLHRPSFARYFESTLEELVAHGHRVHIAIDEIQLRRTARPRRHRPQDPIPNRGADLIDRLCAEHDGITRGAAPVRRDRWAQLAFSLRQGVDYLRVLTPEYANAPKLRARMAADAPALIRRVTGWPLIRSRWGLRLLDRVMRGLDRAIPDSRDVVAFLSEQRPDLLLITTLISTPRQLDYVRAARALGVRSALCVASWDNLTNKGVIQEIPDRVYLWNEYQRREAMEMHGVPADRIVTTGAQCFDQWFERRPSTGSDEFRRRVGFDADSPIVLYVCSYEFVAPEEPRFVECWVDALRAHRDERLRSANVLIRPYPATPVSWDDQPVAAMPKVTVWPPAGALPTDEEAKSGFYDSLFHSSAVVGINTSAMIEAAIIGRRVFTVLDTRFRDTQEGTLHFHYLMRDHGGPVTVAHDLDEHLEQLAGALAPAAADDQARRFVARFVRPHGLDRPALPFLVGAIEEQASAVSPRRRAARLRRRAGAVALAPAAHVASRNGARGPRSRSRRQDRGTFSVR